MSLDEPRPDTPGRARGPGRFLAPLALIAVVVVVIVIVTSHTGSTSTSSSPSVTSPAAQSSTSIDTTGISTLKGSSPTIRSAGRAGASTTASTGTSTAGTYTIASGDTFAAISQKTGVPVTTIEKLNPGVSSSKLSIGQVIKLK